MSLCRSLFAGLVILCSSAAVQAANLLIDLGNGNFVPYQISTARDVSIAPGTGNITLRLQPSSGTAGDGWCPTTGGPVAPTVNFNVSTTTITTGGSVTASWSTVGATSCTSAGSTLPGSVSNWTTSLPTASSGLVLTMATAGNYVFQLSCTGAGGTTTSSRTVTVNDPGPTACTGVTPIQGTSRKLNFTNSTNIRNEGNTEFPLNSNVSIANYSPVWTAHSSLTFFPSRNGTGGVPLLSGEYAAMEFNTGTATGTGTPWGNRNYGGLLWTASQTNTGGIAMVAISECPGDFTQRLPSPTGCVGAGVSSSINFQIGTGTTRCPLQLNKTYYLNIGFFDTAGNNTCGNSLCHFFGTPD